MQETIIGLDDSMRARYGRSIGSTAGVHDPLSAGGTSGGARREVFTIRAPGVNGAILFGRDGIRIQGETVDEIGAVTIGPDGVRVGGREGRRDWGRVDIDKEGVRIEGED